ncbi:unnamed protein product [marine sediment metagenome]|uniref:Uncharacterized protein n=1 Tax=marine sediment metagenome TaxID=412755 RepID=X0UR29_9ZZZZ
METMAACRVLHDYADYALTGTEVEVTATDLAHIKVSAPATE